MPEFSVLPHNAAIITWTVADYEGDFMVSGTPRLDGGNAGAAKDVYFELGTPGVPIEDTGRPAPLTYTAKAEAWFPDGRHLTSRTKILKQDEIDKCRQEYIDYVTVNGKKLEISGVPRNRFIGDINSEFVKNPLDCYAYINPSRAQEIIDLRNSYKELFEIEVKSGYRSPRKNLLFTEGSAETSWHMYGYAVDVVPKPKTDINKNILWAKILPPKILERASSPNIILKYISETEITELLREFVEPTIDLNNNKVPDMLEDLNKNNVPDTLEGITWDKLAPYLIMGASNTPKIISSTDWIHLGR